MSFLNQFKFQTPENVEIEFVLAGIGNRALALLFDYTILAVLQILYFLLLAALSQTLADGINALGIKKDVTLWVSAIASLLFFFIYLGYFIFFETLWRGQTPGKRRVKIRVIRDDGRPVRLPQATLRSILRPIDDFFCLGLLMIIFGKREKRLGDQVAGTIVIQEEQPVTPVQFALSPAVESLATYLHGEADLSRLSPEDFAVIRDYLRRRREMNPEARIAVSRKLAEQLRQRIALATVPEDVTPSLFLEAVYLAYQQRSSEY